MAVNKFTEEPFLSEIVSVYSCPFAYAFSVLASPSSILLLTPATTSRERDHLNIDYEQELMVAPFRGVPKPARSPLLAACMHA